MIMGLGIHPHARCFEEINRAVEQMTKRLVVFNAHNSLIPTNAIVYNFENIPQQVNPVRWTGHEVWDFNEANAAKYWAKYVPIGYHPSMECFEPRPIKIWDVIFFGSMNERRAKVIEALRNKGLSVQTLFGAYGMERDRAIACSKLALNMFYYENGVFPALRVAHCVANKIPIVSEQCPDGWEFLDQVPYNALVDEICRVLSTDLNARACNAYNEFKKMPFVLPAEHT